MHPPCLPARTPAGAVFIANKAYVQGALIWGTLMPALAVYDYWCMRTHLQAATSQPLGRAHVAPVANNIDPELFMPPALREGAKGWWPQGGLVWEKYGLSMYGI